ncbi:CHAT domain-containing protein [Umezawaea tangerina]|uniref:CHAT domain-containing protein n=1 Tax=Umezawaea tangerina TaxID=84725 RepID=A0A2T0SLH9_9PSEU|nr:CHAT domain-containing protein [Umezawaea tangerina]PRY34264.1 CHAT domain-containing protein [Umezawaea tangerina]
MSGTTDHEWSDEEVREVAGGLAHLLITDPDNVEPSYAGAIGHLRMFGIDVEDGDLSSQLDDAVALLRHGTSSVPHDEMLGAWMLSLATALGLLEEWDEAVLWGERAAAFPYTDDSEAGEALLEFALILVERAKAVPTARDGLPHALDGLAERSALPEIAAAIRIRQARVLALRWDAGGDHDDLRGALNLLVDNIPLLPPHYSLFTDDLTLFAEVCRQRFLLDGTAPLDDAVKAIEAVIAEEDLPEHHQQLARLLDLLHPDDEGPVRDRIIDALVRAAEDDDPNVWEWCGTLLYDRGEANDDIDDLRAATGWLSRCLEQQDPTEDGAWVPWTTIIQAHDELHRLTGESEHSERVVDCTTRALSLALPDKDVEHDLMRFRLAATFFEGDRTDLARFAVIHPVAQWLSSAQEAVDADLATGSMSDSAARLAMSVAQGWVSLTVHTPLELVVEAADAPSFLEDIVRMLGTAANLEDLPGEITLLMNALLEFFTNVLRAVNGDDNATFTAIKSALEEPALADFHSGFVGMIGMASALTGNRTQGLGPLDLAIDILGDEKKKLDKTPEDRLEQEAMQAFFRVFRAFNVNPDLPEFLEEVDNAWRLLSALPETPSMAPIVEMGRVLHRLVESSNTDLPAEQERTGFWLEHLMVPLRLGERINTAVRKSDPAAIRDVLVQLDRMPAKSHSPAMGVDPVEFVRVVAHEALSKLEPWNREALNLAIEGNLARWERFDAFDPTFGTLAMPFAQLLRRRDEDGDRAFSRRIGREALRATAWKVLVQSGSEHALEMARNATAMVDELTAWCLRDEAVDDLVAVVDARRGLVLKAVNAGRTVADQLAAIGRHDLAEQWTAADGRDEALLTDWQEPDDDWGMLRRTVLRELAEHRGELVDQPSVEEIQHSLRAHGSGCLVYLLPTNEHHDGMALLVPAHGKVRVRPLPDLRVDTAVESYRVAYEARDEVRDVDSVARWRAELGRLCSWAWDVAGGELSRTGEQHGGLVLVPVGPLGLVPWHAARRMIDGAERYLVQDVPVSYVPSARLFRDLVARDEVDGGRAALIGNPARDLPTGAYEAKAIRDAFYPEGSLLGGFGQPPRPWRPAEDGMGTPEEVLALLGAPLPALHLACHAVADMRGPLRSEVRLAAGTLSARRLLAHNPTAVLPLGLVNLAGCTTSVSGTDYDEALSLSTTFLAIGARTVIGSLWRVPSGRTTAHLMFLFYHYLSTERLPPADALRKAQLWMLDPGRTYPASMPDYLRGLAPSPEFDYPDIECWAGFTQQGC